MINYLKMFFVKNYEYIKYNLPKGFYFTFLNVINNNEKILYTRFV